jgi:diketogulonate reductase-like aldo/keto reductase
LIFLLVLNELKENYLESVMISVPNYGSQITLKEFLPVWRVIEDYIDKQKILSAGVCDFMLPFFSDLCESSKVRNFITIKFYFNLFALA